MNIKEYITATKAKPFLKWAGGKSQLLPTIDAHLPADFCRQPSATYIEPFVGGGAVLFFMLQRYPNIKRAVINDINRHLVKTYTVIREKPYTLIKALSDIQAEYRAMADYEVQKEYYLNVRLRFNSGDISDVEEAAYMIFLNRTCFNGLYRENSRGEYNVPFGRYVNPLICDEALIIADSELLKRVEVVHGDFSQTERWADGGYTLVYCDPPYRPLDATSSFNTYVKESFGDNEQLRLRDFFARLAEKGCNVLLSNSDGRGRNANDTFFDDIYRDFIINRVYAKRCINANPSKRGAITELLIRNYANCQRTDSRLF